MRTIIFFVCLTGLLFACYDDKGNYDYNEINQITIQGIDSLIRCDQMDLLYIPVTLEEHNTQILTGSLIFGKLIVKRCLQLKI